jgi:hypothetical protein
MSSMNAQLVAHKVSESIRNGMRVNMGEIIRNSGYSVKTSLKPKLVTNTKSYRTAIRPTFDWFHDQIQRLMDAMANKDHANEDLKTLVYSLDKLIHNYLLLSGGATERHVFVLPSDVLERNDIQCSPQG